MRCIPCPYVEMCPYRVGVQRGLFPIGRVLWRSLGGGADGTRGASMTGVAGLASRGRSRMSPVRATVLMGGKEYGGKKCVVSGVRLQVAWIAGARILWILLVSMNASRPLGLAMRTNSTGHLAGESTAVASSACL